jgi:cyanophycinase
MQSVRPMRRMRPAIVPLAVLLVLSLVFPALGTAQATQTQVPIGGGYTNATLREFSRIVIEHASAPVVDLYVLPSAYGDDPADRAENIALAQSRTDQIAAQCNAVIGAYPDFTHCEATLLILFDRNDAETPANSDPLYDPDADGVWILGGDQTIAMRVLASSPAEDALEDAYYRGVVFGGTSAGAAVESTTMLAGYTNPGWPYNAFERPMIEVWWSNDGDDERGLIFGSDNVIWDQHFFERGRFARLVNVVAQSDEQFGGESRLGVGIDWGTGVRLQDDSVLSRVFGETAVAVIDFETAGGTHRWVGERETLSARNVLTHIMPAGDYVYDVQTRTAYVDGTAVPYQEQSGWSANLLKPTRPQGTLILAGDLLDTLRHPNGSDPVWSAFLSNVTQFVAPRSPVQRQIVIVSAGYGTPAQNTAAAQSYEQELRRMGWHGGVTVVAYDPSLTTAQWMRNIQPLVLAAGVIFIGADQSALTPIIHTAQYRTYMERALATAPVVLTDGGVTSVMGDWYIDEPNPTNATREWDSSESFWDGNVDIARGMGIVSGAAFQSRVTRDFHWGRLYQLTKADPSTIVFGLSEMTALVIDRNGATVAGGRSVVALDGRSATFTVGTNDTIGAFNVVMDIFAPGDRVAPER